MENLFYVIATILFFAWAIGLFGNGARSIVIVLLVIGFFALLLRLFQSKIFKSNQ